MARVQSAPSMNHSACMPHQTTPSTSAQADRCPRPPSPGPRGQGPCRPGSRIERVGQATGAGGGGGLGSGLVPGSPMQLVVVALAAVVVLATACEPKPCPVGQRLSDEGDCFVPSNNPGGEGEGEGAVGEGEGEAPSADDIVRAL